MGPKTRKSLKKCSILRDQSALFAYSITMELMYIPTAICLMIGSVAVAGGSLSADSPNSIRSIPLPEFNEAFTPIDMQASLAASRFAVSEARGPIFFAGLSTVSPSAVWADGLSAKLAAIEPAPFNGSDQPGGDTDINNFFNPPSSSIGSGLSNGSATEADRSRVKTVAVPLPTPGILAVVGVGAIVARRRRD